MFVHNSHSNGVTTSNMFKVIVLTLSSFHFAIICAQVTNSTNTTILNDCNATKCGVNAYCDPENNTCRCKLNFTGDPYDVTIGCEPQVTTKKTLLCSFKNKTYEPATEFFDGCESKCVCSEALEIECSARCAFTVLKGGQLMPHVPNCTIIPDPKDSCCKLIVCDSKTENETITVNNGNSSMDTFVDAVPVDKPILAIGCHHKNKVYSINETFNEGCESICKCKHGSKLECKPRCPTFQGNDRKYCQLMPDPDDPECCKIAVCDVREGERKQNPSIILDSAEPLNSHSANIRIILPKFENNSNDINLQILHAKVDNEADSMDTEKLDLQWQTESVQNESLKSVGNNVFEMKLTNLSASTEFFVKVINAADNSSSNTVVVRTFPAGVDHSFNGCFHGNKTFEIGEQFFDGCEYKCVCREGGLRECEERCPVYIDTVGYENCDWRPAPDDSCCTVPICDKQVPKMPKIPEPDSSQVCVGKDGVIHSLDDSWEEGDGCLKRRCKCVLLANSTVAEECSGGCASIPPTALKPTLECHKPELVVPEDSCLCPYVVCNHSVNPISLPPQLPGPIRPPIAAPKTPKDHVIHNKQVCDYKGRKIEIGEEFHDGCRAICHCGIDTEVHCALIECPHNFGSHVSECFEWDVDPNFVATPPDCCPPPKCKNDGSCTFAGLRFPNFKAVPQHLLPCGTSCVCVNGNVTCDNQCPPLMDVPPASLPCPSSMAFRGYLPGDTCCMHWMCRGNERPAYCSQNGKRYKLGEQWDDQALNGIISRRRCQCKAGAPGQQPIVQCYPGQCPQITDRHVKPSPECPIPVVVTPDDPIMCPYVVCNYSEDAGHNRVNGKDLENVSFISLNATTVRVRFTLPSLLVGLIGHAELHYTTDPSTPGNQWSVQKFARPKRLFDTSNIEYHLTSLRPDTEYYFQIRIIIEALQSGPESEVYKLRLPPIPTTKPTTTEMPPIISIDAQLNVKPLDSTTVLISWRALEVHEKNIIDGLQILYKRSEQSDKEWLKTPTIHREVNSYVLRDLLSGLSYTFDLFFITAEPLTKIVSTKSVTVKLPTKPRDEFDFSVQVEPSDLHTDSSRCVVHLRRLPIPVNKYVNVVKISYKNVDAKSDTPLLEMFRVPSVDGTVTLDGLQPQKHYKAWFDLYLANGHVITANAFDFSTKEAVKSGSNHVDSDQTNDAEALRESSANEAEIIRPYYVALTVVTLFAIITGIGFVAILCVLMRTKCSAKAPITRAPSESAYDNPTYKTYDGDRPVEEAIKNSVTA